MKKGLLLLLPLLAVGLWFALSDPGRSAPVVPGGSEDSTTSNTDARAGDRSSDAGEEHSDPARQVATDTGMPTGSATDASLALLRGRCVDENGNPLAGISARLRGSYGNTYRRKQHEKSNPPVVWSNPEIVRTGPDGRFEFRFAPPPPFSFYLFLKSPDWVLMTGSWSRFEPGTRKDLGDITFVRGAEVTGQLVDEAGVPYAGEAAGKRVYLSRPYRRDLPEIELDRSASAPVAADGSFRFSERIDLGTWEMEAPYRSTLAPRPDGTTPYRLDIEIDDPVETLQIAIVRGPAVRQTLTGRVVDQFDEPVQGARVRADGRRGSFASDETDKSGRFVITRGVQDDNDDPFQIGVSKDGYEPFVSESTHDWGSREVTLQIVRGAVLELRVTSADTGEPIERYGVWFHRPDGEGTFSKPQRGGWDHDDGILQIDGVLAGEYLIEVDVPGEAAVDTAATAVEIEAGVSTTLDIALPRRIRQPLILRYADGTPLRGSDLELIDTHGKEFPLNGLSLDQDTRKGTSADVGHIISRADVDADGRAVLSGPEGASHLLRVGGDHVPFLLEDFRLSEEERVLEFPTPARITLQVEPRDVVDEWFALFDEMAKTDGILESNLARSTPRVLLSDPDQPGLPYPFLRLIETPGENGSIGRDGRVVLRGVPDGRWDVRIAYPTFRDAARRPSVFRTGTLAEIVTTSGAQIEETLDVSSERMGVLELVVRLNGAPHAGGAKLSRVMPSARDRSTISFLNSDENGACPKTELPSGVWTAEVSAGEDLGYVTVTASPQITVTAGETTVAVVDATVNARPIRIARPDGSAYDPKLLEARRVGDDFKAVVRPTQGSEGSASVCGPPGIYRLSAPIRSLTNPDDYRAFTRSIWSGWKRGTPREMFVQRVETEARVEVGRIELGADGAVIDLQLPAAWDR